MKDLISKTELFREFEKFVKRSNNSDFSRVPTWNDAVSLVGSAPTIDPAENGGCWGCCCEKLGQVEKVKRGKWDVDMYMTMTCSVCGWIFEHYGGLEEEWNYCPNCGAKMERS